MVMNIKEFDLKFIISKGEHIYLIFEFEFHFFVVVYLFVIIYSKLIRLQHIKKLNESLKGEIAQNERDEGLINTAITYAMRNIDAMARLVSRQCDLEARLARVSEKLTPLPGVMVTPLRLLREKVAVLQQRVAALEACCGDGPRRVEAASGEYASAVKVIAEDCDDRVFELFNAINRVSSEVRAILSMSAAAESAKKDKK